jgi:hypothetical protein
MLLLLACAPALECGPGTVQEGTLCVGAPADTGDPDHVDTSPDDTAPDTDDPPDSDTPPDDTGADDTAADTGDTTPAEDPVVEVYLLAGQSNMDGYAYLSGLPPDWRAAQPDIPLYWSGWGTFAPLQATSYGGNAYVGPEVSFGRTLADAGRTVALVKHAVGGTDLATYWAPGADAADPNVGAGWATFVASMRAAELELDAAGQPWRWAGFAWMQGESDALAPDWAAAYEDNLTHLIARVREETTTPDLPVAIGLIACEGLCDAGLDTVRAAQEAVAAADPSVTTIETLDLPRHVNDPWHYDGPSNRVLGQRLAQVFLGEAPAPAPDAALTLTSWLTQYDGEFTVGWRFVTDRDVRVTDVGGFGTDLLWLSQEWGIWDAGHSLVARGTIPGWYEQPSSWRGGFWYVAVEPFTLPAGDYVIGLVSWSGDGNRYADTAAGVAGPGVTYVEARYASGYWLQYPGTATNTADMAFLGPSFLYTAE